MTSLYDQHFRFVHNGIVGDNPLETSFWILIKRMDIRVWDRRTLSLDPTIQGSPAPYGRNDHIDSVGNQCMFEICLTEQAEDIEVMAQENISLRYTMCHSTAFYRSSIYTLGLHHIRTRLYSLPLKMLHDLFESTLTYILLMMDLQRIDFSV